MCGNFTPGAGIDFADQRGKKKKMFRTVRGVFSVRAHRDTTL